MDISMSEMPLASCTGSSSSSSLSSSLLPSCAYANSNSNSYIASLPPMSYSQNRSQHCSHNYASGEIGFTDIVPANSPFPLHSSPAGQMNVQECVDQLSPVNSRTAIIHPQPAISTSGLYNGASNHHPPPPFAAVNMDAAVNFIPNSNNKIMTGGSASERQTVAETLCHLQHSENGSSTTDLPHHHHQTCSKMADTHNSKMANTHNPAHFLESISGPPSVSRPPSPSRRYAVRGGVSVTYESKYRILNPPGSDRVPAEGLPSPLPCRVFQAQSTYLAPSDLPPAYLGPSACMVEGGGGGSGSMPPPASLPPSRLMRGLENQHCGGRDFGAQAGPDRR
ncbi:hypothetical protein ACOMHN_010537 [Nucella lapillus]